MDFERFLHTEVQRKKAYQLLAGCYYLPEVDALEKLMILEKTLDSLCTEAADYVTQMKGETDFKQLQIDFSKLFVGPFELLAPPYGSIYMESNRRLMGDSTVDVRNRYKEDGLDLSNSTKEAPDHIAIELEYMYYLIFKEIESIEAADLASATDYLIRQRAFLRDHLGVWVTKFADKVERYAETDFFKNLAMATKSFIMHDSMSISELSISELGALALVD